LILTSSATAFAAEPALSFVKDVMPILNKASCTSGPCHGGAKGKNGFKLSLRGYDPEFDYRAIVHEMQGRRINRTDPANSLVLLKPSMKIAHGGAMRIDPSSAYYNTVLRWISEGAPFGDPVSGTVARLDVQPAEFFAAKPGLETAAQSRGALYRRIDARCHTGRGIFFQYAAAGRGERRRRDQDCAQRRVGHAGAV
jgi:hypothetical protein